MELQPSNMEGPHEHPGHSIEISENEYLKSKVTLALEEGLL